MAPSSESCPSCSTENNRILWSGFKSKTFQCSRCLLIWTKTDHSSEELLKIYDESYYRDNYEVVKEKRALFFQNQLRVLNKKGKIGKVLDVGCGIGIFLNEARRAGWEAYGVEPSDAARKSMEKEGEGGRVYGTLQEASFEKGSFDLVTLWDVAAHVPNIKQVLEEVRGLLKKDGRLIIKTPLRPKKIFRLVRLFFWGKKRFGDSLLHIPMQIYHFSPESLSFLLEEIGYRVMEVEEMGEPVKKALVKKRNKKEALMAKIRKLFRKINPKDSLLLTAAPK